MITVRMTGTGNVVQLAPERAAALIRNGLAAPVGQRVERAVAAPREVRA